MTTPYTVGRYLLDRLAELGIDRLFGVPGDYNLNFLSQVMEDPVIEWVGNRNELNAAYAADGYARLKGIGALITTFGVGELSAINGVAGSYAERVPVVAITGTPATSVMAEGLLVHHSLGDGEFQHFLHAYQEVTAAQTVLQPDTAMDEIDRVLRICWYEKRPVYIALPSDVSGKPATPPQAPLLHSSGPLAPRDNAGPLVLEQILHRLASAKRPFVLADFEVDRYHAQNLVRTFIERTGLPISTLSMGKGIIDETHPQFVGVYHGALSSNELQEQITGSDCLLLIGVQLIDTITGSFTDNIDLSTVIDIHPHHTLIEGMRYEGIDMLWLLDALTRQASQHPMAHKPNPTTVPPILPADMEGPITQEHFWSRFQQFLAPHDVLIADQGTAYFGATSLVLPPGTRFIGQPLWGSIGFTLPALLGTQLADPKRRNILLIGDGSFQLTLQELSTIIRWRLHPIIILINNDGYTVERAIHGPEEAYNDIPMWSYHDIPRVFGDSTALTRQVATVRDLDEALAAVDLARDRLVFLEVMMNRMDAPDILRRLGRAMAAQNRY
ncbi:MAG: indolepyruvate decarboxylase [Sulfobacillus thermosulfidooxidans]|nr:MAG: indolepyruvate decarboxylase [Sulfobacillus thermosulfidooxidans]